jgi:hypothetical protein
MDDACCVALALCKTIRQEKTSEEMHSWYRSQSVSGEPKVAFQTRGGRRSASCRARFCVLVRTNETSILCGRGGASITSVRRLSQYALGKLSTMDCPRAPNNMACRPLLDWPMAEKPRGVYALSARTAA